jgi:hypothetical protein
MMAVVFVLLALDAQCWAAAIIIRDSHFSGKLDKRGFLFHWIVQIIPRRKNSHKQLRMRVGEKHLSKEDLTPMPSNYRKAICSSSRLQI